MYEYSITSHHFTLCTKTQAEQVDSPLFRTQLCSTFKGFRIQHKDTKWWPLEEYLRMPIASRFIVIGHVQLRMSFRRDIS
jgi:hypothetical protein